MLLSAGEMQLQAGTEAQAAQLCRNPSHCHHSQAEGESQSTFSAQQCPTGALAPLPRFSIAGTSVPCLHLGSTSGTSWNSWGCPVQGQGLNTMILVGPFLLRVFHGREEHL